MSAISTGSHSGSGFDFWEFVHCARCRLPFSSDSGPTIPFWLTECGHIVCNTHLNADQTCATCGAQKIQLVPLQREMEPPMSEWFRPIPETLDAAASAAKFQQETMASLIRYYKARLQQHRNFIERQKSEMDELKRTNAYLAEQNRQFRQQDFASEKSHSNPTLNSNGKRPLGEPDPHDRDYTRPKTTSSPCSSTTPMGPDRLTLPPGQHAPNFTPNRQGQTAHDESQQQRPRALPDRKDGSSRLIQQYSYIPPSTPQFRPVPLTHTQATPRAYNLQPNTTLQPVRANPGTLDPTSSSSSGPQRFKPAALGPPSNPKAMASTSNDQGKARSRHRNMGPPPTPQRFQPQNASLQSNAHQHPGVSYESGLAPSHHPINSIPATTRFWPPAQRLVPPLSQGFQPQDLQRMDAQFSGGDNSGMISTSGSRPSSRAMLPITGRGQRIPFIPTSRNGFG